MKGEEEYSSVSVKAVSTAILISPNQSAPWQKTSKLTEWKKLGGLNTVAEGSEAEATPSAILPLEYSPVRHRSAIERVLSALQGKDPLLDSAPKVWTTFAVAKNFDITHSPLEDYIIRWLRAYPNSYFLEVLPEVSHQIADGLQNYDLARDSFAILVGEAALDSLRHAREPRVHKYTKFRRRKEELPEHIHTRIEYASKSFIERINDDFANLIANGMQWIDELPEVRRLSAYTQPELQGTVHKLKDLLKDYVRGAIYRVLCVDFDGVPGPDLHHDGGHDLLSRVDRAAVWANLPLGERILSRTYWEALRTISKSQGTSNLDIPLGWKLKGGVTQLSQTERRELDRGTYREISHSELRALVRNGQTHLDQVFTLSPELRSAQLDLDTRFGSKNSRTLPDRTLERTQSQNQSGNSLLASTPDRDLYNPQWESSVEPLQKQSYTLPDRTFDGAQKFATSSSESLSTPTLPIDVPKALKRTQHFHDSLSPPDEKQSDVDSRRKWPFGATRDDPIAQMQNRVIQFSSTPPDGRPATEQSLAPPLSHEPRNEEMPIGVDPWRGYSDQLSNANETLQHFASKVDLKGQHAEGEQDQRSADRKSWVAGYWDGVLQTLAPKTLSTSTKAALKRHKRADPAEFDIWADYADSNGDGKVRRQLEDSKPHNDNFATSFFNLEAFFIQAVNYIDVFAMNKLRSSNHLELGIVNTLVCLEDSEWKYLPLYAGGNDDGSMGVYSDDLPVAEHGFTTAGPEVHDGSTPANSIKASSEFDFVSAGDSASTFNASTATNRGFSDTIRRNHVHAVDSADDSVSDSFTMVSPSADCDDEETFARKQIEAQERIEEAEEAAANEARRIEKGKGKVVIEDENYADLFEGEEEEEEEEEDGNDTDRAEVNDEDESGEEMVMV